MGSVKIGITGSIGMGKTKTASFFLEKGIPVWDADKSVNELYKRGESGYKAIKKISQSFVNNDQVDKAKLLKEISADSNLLMQIESKIHPLVKKSRFDFIENNKMAPILVFDIPLLFESSDYKWLDKIIVVTVNVKEQEARVLKRGKMTRKQFFELNSKQMPIEEKIKLADYVIQTDFGLLQAKRQVNKIINRVLHKNE